MSLLNSVPKQDSIDARRVSIDMSFPRENSRNNGIQSDVYLGVKDKLSFPKVDDLVGEIRRLEIRRSLKFYVEFQLFVTSKISADAIIYDYLTKLYYNLNDTLSTDYMFCL